MAQSLPIPFLKAAQTEPLQANHQFTPDAIGFYHYIFDRSVG